ncbi:IMPACT family protein [Actinomycetospora soli]|uniref:IMPACT family protein n=1 Tax=Actinomycetospora soli TaxID=2893887 RepID=UPI001E387C5A|nr:YigZ family protein [Actinomycetospora soli]MCD2187426.1 IMPACT family protein [Actinomycetospora soli]
MRTLAARADATTEIRRSRFHCRVERVASLDDAEAVIAAARREHPQARHHGTALRLGEHAERQRSSDDGEPAGTTGVPMLEVLTAWGLTDVVAVVSRSFGGVLLGAGGLVRAYGGAVAAALETATLVERVGFATLLVAADHASAPRVEHALREGDHRVADVGYGGAGVTLTVHVRPADVDDVTALVAALTSGRGEVVAGDPVVLDVPV